MNGFCDQHELMTEGYSGCLVCALQKLEFALSRISYFCGPPNGMEVSLYDVEPDEEMVVKQVKERLAMEEQLTPASLLEWCQKELEDVVEDIPKAGDDPYKHGILFGVKAVLTDLMIHFDLEGK